MTSMDLLAAPSTTPFCGTCLYWSGVREFRGDYCITAVMATGCCAPTGDEPDATIRPSPTKLAREKGCEIWRAPESGMSRVRPQPFAGPASNPRST